MVNNEQLKEIIGRIKYEKKLNQEEVAELLGVKNPYLSGMTNGKYPVTENVLRKISEIFGIDTGNNFISPKNKESTKTQNQNMIPLLNDVVTIGGSDIVAEPDTAYSELKISVKDQYRINRIMNNLISQGRVILNILGRRHFSGDGVELIWNPE